MFRFIVCDNDVAFCKREKQFIADFYSEKGIDTEIDLYHTGDEIIALGEKLSGYDAIFLDVSVEKVNGIELGSWLKHAAPKLMIVFVSGNISFALDGYKVGAARYIIKEDERFENSMEECLKFILQKSGETDQNYITIVDGKIRISVGKILYVESKAHKITYHLMKNSDTEQEYTLYGKLDDAEKELSEFGFFRIHKSYLVNMNYVQTVSRYKVVLLDGTEIQVSKNNYKATEDEFVRMRGTF